MKKSRKIERLKAKGGGMVKGEDTVLGEMVNIGRNLPRQE